MFIPESRVCAISLDEKNWVIYHYMLKLVYRVDFYLDYMMWLDRILERGASWVGRWVGVNVWMLWIDTILERDASLVGRWVWMCGCCEFDMILERGVT